MKKRTTIIALPVLALLACACSGTLQVTVERAATPASAPAATARPVGVATPTEVPGPQAFALGNLTVEEYPVVSKDLDTPNHFEFNQRILPAVLERRKIWRGQIAERRVEAANQALARFGYRLQLTDEPPRRRHDLYRGDTLVQANISTVWPISVAASGSDFALLIEDERGRRSWNGHWVLEVDGQVIIDGKNLNEELGYEEIFAWQLLAGQPFYFFRKGGRIGVSYAGQTLAPRYDDVIHDKCCEPAAFNVAGNGTMVWGYALRNGIWNYIEMGVYR